MEFTWELVYSVSLGAADIYPEYKIYLFNLLYYEPKKFL